MKKTFGLLVGAALFVCFFGAQAAAAEKVTLVCYSYGIEKHQASVATKTYLDSVKNHWKGQLDYKLYYADSIIKTKEALDALAAGTIDTLTSQTSYYGGKVLIGDWLLMPFAFNDCNKLLDVFHKPEVMEITNKYYGKIANAKMLALLPLGRTEFFSKNTPITKLEDFKGRKMRTSGGIEGPTVLALGATPVTIASSEVYMAAQRGIVDSATYATWTIGRLKLYEVFDNVLWYPAYAAYGAPLWINKSKWDSFPEDLKKTFIETALQVERDLVKDADNLISEGKKAGEEHGMKFQEMSPQEAARLVQAAQPVYSDWVKQVGPDGERLLQLMGVADKK